MPPARCDAGMKPNVTYIYEVRAETSSGQTIAFGARTSLPEAQVLLTEAQNRSTASNRYWVEEIETTGLFEIPSRPMPRDRYTARATVVRHGPATWETSEVEVLDGATPIARFERNYRMLRTFEPFRQGDRTFALLSPNYTGTSVMDLDTGELVASELDGPNGFCPAGFYVPDWWDVHDGRTLPGSLLWRSDHEWPAGDFGFVWGCVWGDDWSWKVQYLDLSAVRDGILRRDDRFGYVSLAAKELLKPQDFIRCTFTNGKPTVEFHVRQSYDLATGTRIPDEDW